jgi:XTP/dITP diphosphohydrolase
MARTITEDTLVIATHNAGKVTEIAALLEGRVVSFKSSGELGLPEPVEDGGTFKDNALIKARSAARHSGKLALADDSGLCVNGLGGDPGIYSARWAGENKDFRLAMREVETQLDGVADRSAYFVCALALCWPDGHEEIFEGRVNGTLEFPARGEKGFGYDPIFVPDGYDVTFAEINPDEKHAISHRADAFRQLVAACF